MIDAARFDGRRDWEAPAAGVDLTLREFFVRQFAEVFLVDAAPRTWEAYESTISAWEKCTTNPRIDRIDVRTLAAFKAERAATRSASTVNKDLRHIGHMLSKAGPASHRNRDALGLLARTPWVKPCRCERDLPKEVPLESIARVYRACHAATAPRLTGVSPEAWHQALIVYLYNLSARMGHALDQRWSDVDFAAGVILLRPRGDKKRCGRRKPMNQILARHLQAIRTDGDRVFPLPVTKTWFYQQWRRINAAAGLEGRQRVFPHDLKRAALTEAGAIADPFTVQLFGDHASLQTTTKHYTNPARRLAGLAERLPQPEPFLRDDRQRRFEFA